MDGEFLTHGAAVEPLVAAGDVPDTDLVVHQSVHAVVGYELGPVVFGVDRAVGHAVCGVLNLVFLLLGHLHLGVRGDEALHRVVDISVEECRGQSGADAGLLDVDRCRCGGASGDDVCVDAADALAQDVALTEAQVARGVGVEDFGMVVGELDDFGLAGREGAILVGGIVEIDARAAQDVVRAVGGVIHFAGAAVLADVERDDAVGHRSDKAVEGGRHLALGRHAEAHGAGERRDE